MNRGLVMRTPWKENESMADTARGIGQIAPPLELPTEAGDLVSLASRRGQAVLVSFLSHAA